MGRHTDEVTRRAPFAAQSTAIPPPGRSQGRGDVFLLHFWVMEQKEPFYR